MRHVNDSYGNYGASDAKEVVRYTVTDDPAAFYGCKSTTELLQSMNSYLDKYGVMLVDGNDSSMTDAYGNGLQWSTPFIAFGGTQQDGLVVVGVDAERLLEDVENDYADDWRSFVWDLTSVLTHEFTHRYQLLQYEEQRNDYGDSEYAYLTNKNEMAARAFAGVRDLLEGGYTKEQLLQKLRKSDYRWFNETDQLSRYYWLLDEDSDNMRQLKRYLYDALTNGE